MTAKSLLFFIGTMLVLNSYSQPLSPKIVNIPMRDGKTLAADIYRPDTVNKYPVILIQTPYNRTFYRWSLPLGTGLKLSTSKYAFVIVDWRCFYGSTSACVASPDRGKDGYDVVQWIAAQPWSDGKVGTWGPSALGKIQYQTAKEKPANLVCAAPLVAGSQFNYDEYFPGGVYRTEYVEQLDALGYGMSTTLLANPVYNLTWQFAENANMYPESITIPVFMIGGWYDHNISVMLQLFDSLKANSPVAVRTKHKLMMGPWAHGGFGAAYVGSGNQGELSYPGAAGWSDSLALRFFDHYLRGVNNNWDNEPVMRYFQLGEDNWNTCTTWPPLALPDVKLYLHKNGLLDPAVPTAAKDSSIIIYDPRDPSPTYGGTTLKQGLKQGPYNQKDTVESRNDILVFSTPVLTQNVKLKETTKAVFYVSSNRFDTDFAIRLTDVYPDGRSMLVSDGIRRMRFRKGFTAADTSRIVPGQIYQVQIDLPSTAITFLAGHRIRIDITSSNYPRFDSNLNNGNKMYVAGDTLVATNTVYFSNTKPSYVSFAFENYPTGVKEMAYDASHINIYPNPSSGKLFIELEQNFTEPVQLDVFSSTGQRVYSISMVNGMNKEKSEINTSNWDAGIYMIRITSAEQTFTRKIIVE